MANPSSLNRLLPHGLFLLAAIIMLVPSLTEMPSYTNDPDAGWHIAAGDLVRTLGYVPSQDPWAHTTSPAYPWYNISWLWDIGLSLLHEQGGLYPAIALYAILMAVLYGALALFCRKLGAETLPIIIGLFVTYPAFLMTAGIRPHIISYVLLLTLYWLLHTITSKQISRCWLLAIPCMFTLWANVHGGFIAGFTVIGAFGLQAIAHRKWKDMLLLTAVGVISIGALCINPFGTAIFEASIRTLTSELNDTLIMEWQPPSLNMGNLVPFGYILLFAIVAVIGKAKTSLADRILAIAWMLAALQSIRHLTVFALLSLPYFTLQLTGWYQLLKARNGTSIRSEMGLNEAGMRSVLAIAVVICIGVFLSGAGRHFMPQHDFRDDIHPIDAVEFMIHEYPHLTYLNHYNTGGYVIYRTRGSLKLFMDGRGSTAYPPEVVADYLTFHNLQPGWDEVLDKYGIEAVLLPKGPTHPHTNIFNSIHYRGWVKTFSGENADIFIREDKVKRQGLALRH